MKKIKSFVSSIVLWIRKKPLPVVLALVLAMLGLVILGEVLFKDEVETDTAEIVVDVTTYPIGTASSVEVMGRVEKSGFVTIVAQTSGIVNQIEVETGQSISRGKSLLRLATNYSGGNIAGLQWQLAKKQFDLAEGTLQQQLEVLNKQRELANKADENAAELREIGRASIGEAKDQLSLNESIVSTLNTNLTQLEEASQSAQTEALILSTKQMKSQFLAAVNQLRQLIRQTEYQSSDEQPAAKLGQLQKDVTVRQLDLQQKSIELGVEIARLNYLIAGVSASLSAPTAPIAGVVERVYVRPFQAVQPGQPLVRISGETSQLMVVVPMSGQMATRLSKTEAAEIDMGGQKFEVVPDYVSIEPLEDSQYRAFFHLPLEAGSSTFDGEFVAVKLKMGYPSTSGSMPVIPIDAVYQMQDKAYVYLREGESVVAREVKLGGVVGSVVDVVEGLSQGDVLITSRNVAGGDKVQAE